MLWRDYTEHYEPTAVATPVLQSNWQAIIDGRLHAFALCLANGEIIGFTHYVFYPSTKSVLLDCYMIDLYVALKHRGQGGGQYMLDALLKECQEKKLFRITWLTQKYNIQAQRLYEKMAKGEEFVRYKILIE